METVINRVVGQFHDTEKEESVFFTFLGHVTKAETEEYGFLAVFRFKNKVYKAWKPEGREVSIELAKESENNLLSR
tara:strand:- start:353 stop:580 length:228 start_codon:yes stop_codon:yes gene_type:complete